MSTSDSVFINGLIEGNIQQVKAIPKSDLHCHAGLSFKLWKFEKWAKKKITPPPKTMSSIAEMNSWIKKELAPYYTTKDCFEFSLETALEEAIEDGVVIIEMSIDNSISALYPSIDNFASFISNIKEKFAPKIEFRPELGIAREVNPNVSLHTACKCIDTGVFNSIDLYGIENAREPEVYKKYYEKAKSMGLKCKIHTGEFGSAKEMEKDIKTLNPDVVQHGIAAAVSNKLITHLVSEGIALNICPTSNIKLLRVAKYKNHPIKKLFDAGVTVTLNSDDIMLFNSNITDEYFNLFNCGLLSAEELNVIRLNGLKQ